MAEETSEESRYLADLMDFAPRACEMIKMELETDAGRAWKQQLQKLKEWRELEVTGGDMKHSAEWRTFPERSVTLPNFVRKPLSTRWTFMDRNMRIPARASRNSAEDYDDEDEDLQKVLRASAVDVINKSERAPVTAEDLRNDQIFISLVEILTDYEKTKTSRGDTFVFHAISRICPKAGFPFELRERYLELTGNAPSTAQKLKVPNKNMSRKNVLQPFHRIFCRRCYLYNCLSHGASEKVNLSAVASGSTNLHDGDPCGPNCYKIPDESLKWPVEDPVVIDNLIDISTDDSCDIEPLWALEWKPYFDVESLTKYDFKWESDQGSTSSSESDDVPAFPEMAERHWRYFNCSIEPFVNVPSTQPEKSQYEEIFEEMKVTTKDQSKSDDQDCPDSSWSHEELSMYIAIKKVMPNQFCSMAKVIQTKTCVEVHKLSQTENFDCSVGNLERVTTRPSRQRPCYKGKTWLKQTKACSRSSGKKPPLYTPCSHPGNICNRKVCVCMANGIPCEKFCACFFAEEACENQFHPCRCQKSCETKCPCVRAGRECDMDLCCCDIKPDNPCSNAAIQSRKEKKVYVAPSLIAGKGLFAQEPMQAGDLIGEYIGEIITIQESERRGTVYDHIFKRTYLFDRNDTYCLDSMHFGNLIRYMNSSPKPNCYALVKSVYGDLRIGLYAHKPISVGDELTFDYMKAINKQIQSDEVPSTSVGIQRPSKYCKPLDASSGVNFDFDSSD